VKHEVLNAKQHTREAQIVAQAGRLSAITVATNMAGRGGDIILGGNPEGLARRDVLAEGLDIDSDDGQARYHALLPKYDAETKAEGEKVRELGGLYVLGTERHESRRIDNQLRGRSGRQGDPGSSRFYLSLEDELMRIFATGALNWVMSKALPDDVPIEAKMVTKAIERAQNTVETKNAEIRKNVLKYDEVMNEQRKVIYRRRDQILAGSDLREETMEYFAQAVDGVIRSHAGDDSGDEWDLDALVTELQAYWPTTLTRDDLESTRNADDLYEKVMSEATSYYEQREQLIGPELSRDIERQVMLRLIDQHWRDHLYEMDYLREGIHLRAYGQVDPAVAWQREGFDMFAQMMSGIADDFVKYIMHVQVAVEPAPQSQITNVQYSAPEDPVQGAPAVVSAPGAEGAPPRAEDVVQQPVVKSEWDKTPRNAPCPCGSGKKFKLCHGA